MLPLLVFSLARRMTCTLANKCDGDGFALAQVHTSSKIVAFTGAGISKAAGLPRFHELWFAMQSLP